MTNVSEDLRTARRVAVLGMFDFTCKQVAMALTVAEQRHSGRCVAIISGRTPSFAMVHSLGELQRVGTLANGNPDFTNLFAADNEGLELQTLVNTTDDFREWLDDPKFRILTDAELALLDSIHRSGPVRDAPLYSAPAPDIKVVRALWSKRGQACCAVLADQLATLREALIQAEAESGQRTVAPVGPYWLSGESKLLVVGNHMANGELEMDHPCDTDFDRVGDETIVALSEELEGWNRQDIRSMTAAELKVAKKSDMD